MDPASDAGSGGSGGPAADGDRGSDARPEVAIFDGTEAEARRRLCRTGKELHDSALIGGRAGNLSVRLNRERLLVTPRGSHKGHLDPRELVVVSPTAPDPEAEARATSELPFHRTAYAARPDVAAVVHSHAPALTAAGLREIDVTARFPEIEGAMGSVGRVPFRPSGSEALGAAVGRAAGEADLLILERHGVLAFGATPEEARDRTELAELTAWAALLAVDAGLGLDLRRVAELHGRIAEGRGGGRGQGGGAGPGPERPPLP